MKRLLLALAIIEMGLVAGNKPLTPRPPIYGIPAKTLPRKRLIIRGYFIYPHFVRKYNPRSGIMEKLPPGTSLRVESFVLKLRYGITSRLTAIANFPFVGKKFSTPSFAKSSSGIGDSIGALLFKLHHDRKNRFITSVLLWSKWPTARTKNLSSDEIPLGTGSYDYGIALLPEKEFGKWDLRWCFFYKIKGKNYQGKDQPNQIILSWSTAYNLSYRFIPEVSLVYTKEFPGAGEPAFYSVKMVAGGQFRIKRTFLVQAAALANLKARLPFADDFTLWLGFYSLF